MDAVPPIKYLVEPVLTYSHVSHQTQHDKLVKKASVGTQRLQGSPSVTIRRHNVWRQCLIDRNSDVKERNYP
jgi:hypothetical protein